MSTRNYTGQKEPNFLAEPSKVIMIEHNHSKKWIHKLCIMKTENDPGYISIYSSGVSQLNI